MKRNILQNVIGFIFKYVWFFCALLIILEIGFTFFSAKILMKQNVQGVLLATSGEIRGKVEGVSRLLEGLSQDERFRDQSKTLFERIVQARPYAESYDLFMLGLTDQELHVVSTRQKVAPVKLASLAQRPYMQKLYATGQRQITDVIKAGADGVTLNYTVAVPILQEGKTIGSIFGAIYFKDIKDVLVRNSVDLSKRFYLIGADGFIMVDADDALLGKTIQETEAKTYYFGTDLDTVDHNFQTGVPCNVWSYERDGLCYLTSMRIEPTNWTLVYQVRFWPFMMALLPVLLLKTAFYVLLCTFLYVYGRRHLKRQLAAASHLLDRVVSMQRELFQSEQPDCELLLELTEQGLTDQLTGLATRGVLFNRMQSFLQEEQAQGAVFFLDLDDLKRVNDTFGHEVGDKALLYFAEVLQRYEKQYTGIAARYGGDEFILLLSGINAEQAEKLAAQLCVALRATLRSPEGHQVPIHGSIGIAFYPEHGQTAEGLICKADFALYAAKQNGKNRYACYDKH
ncbi:MAG: sensor domain-containing diguanylate cyclase [Acidaminococcaceae bacterium]